MRTVGDVGLESFLEPASIFVKTVPKIVSQVKNFLRLVPEHHPWYDVWQYMMGLGWDLNPV